MKKYILTLCMVALLAGPVVAQEGDLGVTVDATWVSKYIWRGFDILDDKAAFQPSIDLNLWDSGFHFTVWTSWAGSSKGAGSVSTVNLQEWDYAISYEDTLLEGDQIQTDYTVAWVYYDYPDEPSSARDAQEFNVDFSWPRICPFGVVPHYQLIYNWPAEGGPVDQVAQDAGIPRYRDEEGFVHIFGMSYDTTVPGFMPDNPEQKLSFTMDMVYNDGTYGAAVDHDWSHIVWGLTAPMRCPWTGGTLTPAVYYQKSMDDSVNDENELWTGLSYTYKF